MEWKSRVPLSDAGQIVVEQGRDVAGERLAQAVPEIYAMETIEAIGGLISPVPTGFFRAGERRL